MAKTFARDIVNAAWRAQVLIPAFNTPYLPVMAPTVRALRDARCFGLIAVARPEWTKFQAHSIRHVRDEYERVKDERFTRLHLDHVPVIDEDDLEVDWRPILADALRLGYESVMIDASRLPLDANIAVTREVVEMARAYNVPVEAELGAILGHGEGPLPPYEELFASRKGFTDPDEARRFVAETGADWLSVAFGSVHGAISAARKHEKKVAARLDIEHLDRLSAVTGVPLVLHGGTGIPKAYVLQAARHGIAKINIAAATRQAYESHLQESVEAAQQAVYETAMRILCEDLDLQNTIGRLPV